MYNGIGLDTARGSGTNGYVQRNLAFIKMSKDKPKYRTEEDIQRSEAILNRAPNPEILQHERLRKIELKCFELRELMSDQNYEEEEIEEKVNDYRKLLMQQLEQANEPTSQLVDEYGRPIARETHQIAELQTERNQRLKNAFGIREDYVSGDAIKRGLEGPTTKVNEEKTEKVKKESASETIPEEKAVAKKIKHVEDDKKKSEKRKHKNLKKTKKRRRDESSSDSSSSDETSSSSSDDDSDVTTSSSSSDDDEDDDSSTTTTTSSSSDGDDSTPAPEEKSPARKRRKTDRDHHHHRHHRNDKSKHIKREKDKSEERRRQDKKNGASSKRRKSQHPKHYSNRRKEDDSDDDRRRQSNSHHSRREYRHNQDEHDDRNKDRRPRSRSISRSNRKR